MSGANSRPNLDLAVIDAITERHSVEPGSAIPILQEIQSVYGYIDPLAVERAAKNMKVSSSSLFGILTFYAQFRTVPLGENTVLVCHGTACHLAGAERIADILADETGAREGETSKDGKFTIERVACLGCCSLAPCIMLNENTYGKLTPEAVNKLVSKITKHETTGQGVQS